MYQLQSRIQTTIYIKPIWFFRIRLLSLTPEGIQKLIETYEKEVGNIKKSAISYAWYLRGGVTYEDVLNMSYEERNYLSDLVEHNLEITKKSNLPFF
jgi:hypothetical protein